MVSPVPRGRRPNRRIKVTGVRRKQIDTKLLAYVYFQEGKRMVEERRAKGLPQSERTPEQLARLEEFFPEFAKIRKQLQQARERLGELGVSLDTPERPELPESELSGPRGPTGA